LILDEADRLLQLGFQDELMELVSHTPSQKQTLLFSATMTTAVDQLMNLSVRIFPYPFSFSSLSLIFSPTSFCLQMKRPVKISVDANLNTTSHLRQEFIRITPSLEKSRESILLSLCKRNFFNKTIIFFPLKWQAHRMKIVFGLCQLNAGELHGDMSQAARLSALQDFRDEKVDYLLCTDVAARGLDIPHVETVINFAFPKEVTTYIHRVGRTARAGKSGVSVTLVGEKHRHLMKEVVKRVNKDQKKNSQKQNIKARTIPISIINQYKNEIELIEEDVSEIKALETEEKNLRRAEMEANKVRNMMVHEEDIQARPRRTWFQTKQEKEAASLIGKPKTTEELEKEQEEQSNLNKYGRKKTNDKDRSTFSKFGVIGATGNEKKRPHRLSRKKRRRLEAEIQADKEDRRERREARTRNEEHISVSGKEQAKINDNRQASSARLQKKAKREGGQINAEKLSDKRKENKRKGKREKRERKITFNYYSPTNYFFLNFILIKPK
jgi:ATP-dependent RNA helicase DDX27